MLQNRRVNLRPTRKSRITPKMSTSKEWSWESARESEPQTTAFVKIKRRTATSSSISAAPRVIPQFWGNIAIWDVVSVFLWVGLISLILLFDWKKISSRKFEMLNFVTAILRC
jgi:hypothetical protein